MQRYTWVPEDEESMRLEGPRPVLPPIIPSPPASMMTMQGPQAPKTKHVSFARSHTLTSFEVPRNRSPPRPHNPERLIDSQPTMQNTILPSSLPLAHPYPGIEPRVLVLGKSCMPFLAISYRVIRSQSFSLHTCINSLHVYVNIQNINTTI